VRSGRRSDDRGVSVLCQFLQGTKDSTTIRRSDFRGASGVRVQDARQFGMR
jgi:hypothetical protein